MKTELGVYTSGREAETTKDIKTLLNRLATAEGERTSVYQLISSPLALQNPQDVSQIFITINSGYKLSDSVDVLLVRRFISFTEILIFELQTEVE